MFKKVFNTIYQKIFLTKTRFEKNSVSEAFIIHDVIWWEKNSATYNKEKPKQVLLKGFWVKLPFSVVNMSIKGQCCEGKNLKIESLDFCVLCPGLLIHKSKPLNIDFVCDI